MMIDAYIYELPNGWHSLIDSRSFLRMKQVSLTQARQACREHVAAILKAQDGDKPQHRTLSERRNIFVAMTP